MVPSLESFKYAFLQCSFDNHGHQWAAGPDRVCLNPTCEEMGAESVQNVDALVNCVETIGSKKCLNTTVADEAIIQANGEWLMRPVHSNSVCSQNP